MIRKIIIEPNPMLHQKSLPVEKIDGGIKQLCTDMFETMYSADGAGLAAVQIAVLKRVIVMDLGKKTGEKDPLIFINPVIIWMSDEEVEMSEGCLSLPGGYANIFRPAEVKVKFLDIDGVENEIHADGWLARAIQHEYDHLDGILETDRLSKLKRDLFLNKVKKYIISHKL